jgi:hypothetical protein
MVCVNPSRRPALARADLHRYLEQMAHLLKNGRLCALAECAEALAVLAGHDNRGTLFRPAARLLGAAEQGDIAACVASLVQVAVAVDAMTD